MGRRDQSRLQVERTSGDAGHATAQHGRVTIRSGGVFPNFPASNVRNVCNTRRVPGVEAYYRPEPGYLGFDSVGFETIFPSGDYRTYTANIQVR